MGTLFLAAMLADLLWCIFLYAGVEQVQFVPGKGAAAYFHATNIAFSHSLLMDVVWAAILAGAYFLVRRDARAAWVLAAVVLSHWLLDWISHGPDMPLSPGLHDYFGLGLWRFVAATVVIEGGFWAAAVILFARDTRPKGMAGVFGAWWR